MEPKIITYQELIQTIHPFREMLAIGYFWDDPLKRLDFLNGIHSLADQFHNFWKNSPDRRGVAISRIHEHKENYRRNLLNHKGKVERDIKDIELINKSKQKELTKKKEELKEVEQEILTNNKYKDDEIIEKAREEKNKYKNVMEILDGRLNSLKHQYDNMIKEFRIKEEKYQQNIGDLTDELTTLSYDFDISRSLLVNIEKQIHSELTTDCKHCQSTLMIKRENLIRSLHSMDIDENGNQSSITKVNPIIQVQMHQLHPIGEQDESGSEIEPNIRGDDSQSDLGSDWST